MLSARVNLAMTGPFDYSLFGLHIRSELPLPELLAVENSSPPHVTIQLGKVPEPPEVGRRTQVTGGGLLLLIDEVGGYFIKDGSTIVVEPQPGAPDANVRIFLLG